MPAPAPPQPSRSGEPWCHREPDYGASHVSCIKRLVIHARVTARVYRIRWARRKQDPAIRCKPLRFDPRIAIFPSKRIPCIDEVHLTLGQTNDRDRDITKIPVGRGHSAIETSRRSCPSGEKSTIEYPWPAAPGKGMILCARPLMMRSALLSQVFFCARTAVPMMYALTVPFVTVSLRRVRLPK